jgi:hypothetical protein
MPDELEAHEEAVMQERAAHVAKWFNNLEAPPANVVKLSVTFFYDDGRKMILEAEPAQKDA